MRKLRALWLRLLGLAGTRTRHSDVEDEIASHIAMHTADGVRAGLSETEARRRALIRIGGAEQARQAYRERGTLPWFEDLLHDLRHALRMMLRNRSFTAVAVLTLAIGIGASATVFTWINEVLIEPLSGVADPARLVTLNSVTPNGEIVPNSYPDFIDFRDHLKLFDGIAVSRPMPLTIGMEDHAERVWGELVSGNFFSVLSVRAQAGRLFLPAEFGDAPGKYPIAVISDRYWRSHYGADPSIVGRTL
ncbi:MAG TPA: permease prefix domain 1-containing protein, partial [Terracidiphilus sp.]|nr:permease prefix domain 1-containing protein [Terracidiphilus sp.]